MALTTIAYRPTRRPCLRCKGSGEFSIGICYRCRGIGVEREAYERPMTADEIASFEEAGRVIAAREAREAARKARREAARKL